ncbi:nuclear protein SNF4 [Verticillium alfalfae VaMs.102]|uniref:Nuclear protein SNF4 n=1 Tax=Verticillium alfalfae (strain VaMs.102 / ATCC MYA-4576 / FGSC 10136) TaxID=526221 RepID=C9SRL7_VERA1|nr:nuclear protein SNF4 [Verticillium alfalfae VaMs.102]EEY21432.1 nuclear protein SNF4 [Verticillium alfalfae VaMs.102]
MPDHDMDLENNPAAAAPADSGAEAGTVPEPRVTVAAEVAAAALPPPAPQAPPQAATVPPSSSGPKPNASPSGSGTQAPPVFATAASIARPNVSSSSVSQSHPQPHAHAPQLAAPAPTHGQGHELPFVTPSSYLRPKPAPSAAAARTEMTAKPLSPLDKEQMQGLRAIREFLKVRTSYDVLPLSFRLIVLDNDLLIKKSLNILIQNYIEKAIGVSPLETVSVNPMRPLYEACRRMLKTKARRIPLVDLDDETRRETVVSVITQYRILKFIAVNNEHNTVMLKKAVRDVGLGTWGHLATAHMSTSVLDVVSLMVKHDISCVPLVDKHNRLLNVFEAVDIIPCIKGGAYDDLSSSVGEALCKRPDDFPGIYTCGPEDRLDSIFDTVRKSRVHRLIVVDDENRLVGIISLSDILKYVLLHGEEDDLR